MAPKILFVLTSHSALGNSGKKTGWFLPELSHPVAELEGKAEIIVASPLGGEAPLDPNSVEPYEEDPASIRLLNELSHLYKNTSKLEDWVGKEDEFAAIFYVGGHGPMFDLATSTTSIALIKSFYESNKIVSAVCHGPAAFVNVKLSDGSYLVDGKNLTAFSDEEEVNFGTAPYMPFKLEMSLKEHGAKFTAAKELYGEKLVVDGKFITGENPASARAVGKAIAEAL
ncbi:hypothetical protein M409DRAFT_58936 [Zasmidium cellare ATCC 36951]|uniref:D-lactate dehydratase n=1 Tax=Zasmidium cellare ATCC 36951 TaxID=1080233 RepID=A0A6A6C3N3_ZASCE|nr:uncharacterized protein M409DRAFT_58936 [Zasmidium cellare ATCC 36951]KAF2161533.1 hypothetical protein M409DRAFT_58936 [Zasmidium cellare ATCC 36951]